MPERVAMNPVRLHAGKLGTVAACAMAALPFTASALPVIPNASGYGIETPAGRGGKVYKVVNLNPDGAGSLRACVEASGPRVCVFEVSGTIVANKDLIIRNPYITIAGQTAPSPGVMWRGGALWVATTDVLVQHMRFRPGDDPNGPDFSDRDALKIAHPTIVVRNVVIDHCSFSWSTDENVQLWASWDDITLTNNISSEGLHDSLNQQGTAGYGLLVGPYKGRVSISGNLLAHNYARNPLSRGGQMVFVNNVVYGAGNFNVDLQSEGLVTNNTIIGNTFIRSPDSATANKPVHIRNSGNWPVPPGSKVYVSDNQATEATADAWSVVDTASGAAPTAYKADLPPTWPSGLTTTPGRDNVSLDDVLRNVGARPADRDSVDRRIIQQVRTHTGGIINCVSPNNTARCSKNAGGWPTLAENRRALTLPSDPNGVAASGYTNLEVWLHGMSAEVEGRSKQTPAAPKLVDR
jgi:hypothetical protein